MDDFVERDSFDSADAFYALYFRWLDSTITYHYQIDIWKEKSDTYWLPAYLLSYSDDTTVYFSSSFYLILFVIIFFS